jgi:hypothetical protein
MICSPHFPISTFNFPLSRLPLLHSAFFLLPSLRLNGPPSTLPHVGYDYMGSRLAHDQTFTGCSNSIMGCTQDFQDFQDDVLFKIRISNPEIRNKSEARIPKYPNVL